MACYKPMVCLSLYDIKEKKFLQSKNFIRSNEENRLKIQKLADLNNTLELSYSGGQPRIFYEMAEVNCRKCLGCRLAKSAEWAQRIMLEVESSQNCYFVTLTFDDDHLNNPSLDKKAFSSWLKKFREAVYRKYGVRDVRFYVAGEYGKKNLRKHYHIIFINLPLDSDDLVPFQYGKSVYYRSKFLEEQWQFGFVVVGEVTFNSAGYVARYTMKKAFNFLIPNAWEPEFTNMSRRPGIGRVWFEDHWLGLYDKDSISMRSSGKIRYQKPSSYFDKLMKQIDPEKLSDVKFNRRYLALNALNKKLSKTTLSLDDQRLVDLENLILNTSSLKRLIEC